MRAVAANITVANRIGFIFLLMLIDKLRRQFARSKLLNTWNPHPARQPCGCRAASPRGRGTAQRAVQPPSISRLVPVTREAAGDARNTIAPAISSICPIRPRGILLITQSRNSGSARNEAVIGVSRKVGAMEFTRMFFGFGDVCVAR